ncbi:MAG: hypothetical protein OER85_07450, partial [Gammaproteobacteria bacterium]|nr:hypothetical protein [Gammaproteobacteria bacterium]
MLLSSVIIVLREVLEAALIISVLLALANTLSIGPRWTGWGVGFGLLGAVVYAGNTAAVSDWFDGVGQEVVNALIQFAIYCCLMLFAVMFSMRHGKTPPNDRLLARLMIVS